MKKFLLILSIVLILSLLSSCMLFKGELQKISGPDSIIHSNEANFSWKGSVFLGNIDRYEYKKDSGNWKLINASNYLWTDLSEGYHTFSVRGFNKFGKETGEISWTFEYSNNPDLFFCLEGYVRDSDSFSEIANVSVVCNIFNSQNEVVKTLETESDSNGHYKLKIENAAQLNFNEMTLKAVKTGYEISFEIVEKDMIQDTVYDKDLKLVEISIPYNEKYSATLDLPGNAEDLVFSADTMSGSFPTDNKTIICNNKTWPFFQRQMIRFWALFSRKQTQCQREEK